MTKLDAITIAKQFRVDADALLQRMKEHRKQLPEALASHHLAKEFGDAGEVMAQHTLSMRDLESAIMRQGMVLKNIGGEKPYPESYNPASPVIEPPADGLKM